MSLTGTWPQAGDPADPFDDEPADASGLADYTELGGTLDAAAYAALEEQFRTELSELRRGRGNPTTVAALASALLLDQEPEHEPRPRPCRAQALPTHEDLARICTDLCPAASGEALDRHLGPLADELDLLRPHHRKTALAALAAFCFVRQDGAMGADGVAPPHGRSAYDMWCRRKPLPTAEERADLRAVSRAPMGVWSLEAEVEGRWRVVDRLGLSPSNLPDTPVRIPELAAPWRPPRPGDTLIARIAQGPDGWTALCAFALPTAPPTKVLHTWLRLALWEGRLLDRRLTVEDLQRRFSTTLVRRLFEWAWLHGDDDPYRDPVLYDLEYADHDEDVAYYGALARTIGGPILELGCGTGRLAVAMARTGADVDGVDLSQPMLDGLRRRLAGEPTPVALRIRTWRDDFRRVRSDRKYRLIAWPFNALHHCRSPEEVRAVLDRIQALLLPGGLLAFDCYLPAMDLYDRDPNEKIEPRTFQHPVTGEPIRSWEQGWWDEAMQVHHVLYVYEHPDGRRTTTHLQLRMHSMEALRALFREAGWNFVTEAQDFRGTPLRRDALKWVAQLRRS